MSEGAAIVFTVCGIVAFIATLVWLALRAQRRRLAELQQVAHAMGFTFHGETPRSALEQWVGTLPLFSRGHTQRAQCVLVGEIAGLPVVLTDFTYVIGSGKNRTARTQTVAVFTDAGRGLPDFDLCPENIFHQIGQVFGYQDIDFEGHVDFSRRYLLRGIDETGIRAAFGSLALDFLAGEPGWSVQTRGGRLAVFREGKRVRPPVMPAFLADALRIAGAINSRGAS